MAKKKEKGEKMKFYKTFYFVMTIYLVTLFVLFLPINLLRWLLRGEGQ